MTKYYCDVCGKEEKRLKEVRIPHCKGVCGSFSTLPIEVCEECKEEGLTEAITNWLKSKGIENDYCVKYQTVKRVYGKWTAVWEILQICEEGE